jgi:tetratricopeptide (TPR) repeat protein
MRNWLGRTHVIGLPACLGSLVCLTWLTGCGPAAMSVQEAKTVTASFQGAPFVPPPRTLQDITAILDEQRVENPELLAAKAKVGETPPAAPTYPTYLTRFFFDRGRAAQFIGQLRQARADLEQALVHARQASIDTHRILERLAVVEDQAGRPSEAIARIREAARAVPANDRGALFSIYRNLVWWQVRLGDITAAERTLGDLVALDRESSRWTDIRPSTRETWSGLVAIARGAVAEGRGRFSDAGTHYRNAVQHLETDPVQRSFAHAYVARTLIHESRLLEAENEARTALLGMLRLAGRYSPHTATVLNFLTGVIRLQGRAIEAEALARAGIELWEKMGANPEAILLASARRGLALALVDQRRWEEAAAEFETLWAAFTSDAAAMDKWLVGGGGVALINGNFAWPLAVLKAGRPTEAARLFDIALQRSREIRGEDQKITAMLRGGVAMAAAAQGDRERALAEYSKVIPRLSGVTGDRATGRTQTT